MLLLMPLAPYWNARALQTCVVGVYDDMMLDVKGRLGSRKIKEGRSGSCTACAGRRCAQYSGQHFVVIAVFAAVA
jgi:hypothetical protein